MSGLEGCVSHEVRNPCGYAGFAAQTLDGRTNFWEPKLVEVSCRSPSKPRTKWHGYPCSAWV